MLLATDLQELRSANPASRSAVYTRFSEVLNLGYSQLRKNIRDVNSYS